MASGSLLSMKSTRTATEEEDDNKRNTNTAIFSTILIYKRNIALFFVGKTNNFNNKSITFAINFNL